MAGDKKLTGLTQITTAQDLDLLYIVSRDTGDVSNSISVVDFLRNNVTGVNRIISGQVIWTGSGYVFESANLTYELNGNIYISNGEQVTLDAPDATNPRFDITYVDISGLQFKTGIASATPQTPTLDDPLNEIQTSIVLVQNGTTTPPEITNITVYEENAQIVGGEWNTSESTSANRIDLANIIDPIYGTYDILTLQRLENLDSMLFDYDSTYVQVDEFDFLELHFRSQRFWDTDRLKVLFKKDGVQIAQTFIDSNSLNTSDFISTSVVYLYGNSISFSGTEFNEIEIIADAGFVIGQTNLQFHLDRILIQTGGTSSPIDPSIYALKTNVLQLDNTTVFTPDADYEPATKKYVDDNSGGTTEIGYAISDETTALTTGITKVTFRMPFAMTLTDVRASLTTAPTGSSLVVDINESGATILSTKLSIDATEKTSETAATPPVISDSSLADDAEITIDIDQVGSVIAGAGLKIYLIGTKA